MSYKFPFPLNESYFYRQVTDYRTLRQFTDTFYTASYHPSHKVDHFSCVLLLPRGALHSLMAFYAPQE